MKRYICSTDTILAMSKLTKKYADKSLFDEDFGEFIYFSPALDAHGPRIKFYGGSKETSTTRTAPSMSFGVDGAKSVIIQSWMNKDNCPNAFDNEYLNDLQKTVNKFLPIFLLVWFNKLDEADALHYFEGTTSWESILSSIDCNNSKIRECNNMKELHEFCKANQLYIF